ncbi:branched-chain amino acid ABC transporter permease [Caldinitratiruptor microaerophilus]|uniref:Amino acid ABC transporter permease n=1 Tax=Caldinitratiruptor microaerophilus TaxID=671077 RepID=A0AA35CNH4_9FIRM|nr:branched-chain amino acid ABC transporter permease [Caldinitratiruptor microaerophilus]BDG62377.1 amino acid ABC transporter permease [Caldinitratiruptor microaerophilus]
MRLRRHGFLAVGVLVTLGIPLVVRDPHALHVLIMIFLYAFLGTGWNILGGYAGQVSLGHSVYFGIGAYTATLLMMKAGVSPLIGMFVGGLLAALVSLVVGWGCFRLAGHYFAIATLAVAEIAVVLATNWEYIGAAVGVYVPIDRAGNWLRTLQFTTKTGYYYVALTLLALGMSLAAYIERSRPGFYFRAIKADPESARALGVDIFRQKLYAMALSAFLVALGGAVYAQYVLFIDPESVLGAALSIQIALIPVLGGVGSLWGPLIGALVLVPLSEYTRLYFGGTGSGLDLVIYGLLIMLVATYQPAGLMGLLEARRERSKPGAALGR